MNRWPAAWRASARVALLVAVCMGCADCSRSTASQASGAPSSAQAPTPAHVAHPAQRLPKDLAPRASTASGAGHLPEDPVAGKRASQQWDEHLEHEERQRQLVFDRDRMPLHRKLIAQLRAARARYDRASTAAALSKVRAGMPTRVAKIHKGVETLDPWGVSSRLLADYEALQSALVTSYPDARQAALTGDAAALVEARARFDERLRSMHVWLELAKDAKGEGEAEDEALLEHEHERAAAAD